MNGVERVSEVDRQTFEALYREHYWALLRFAVRRSTDPDRARDLVAETFATAWRRRDALPATHALPWLYKVAGNLLANERRRDERSVHALRKLDSYATAQDLSDPAEQVEWSDALSGALRALRRLSGDDQQVLMLHAWEGLQGRELGTALGCSSAAASVRLHRARRRLEAQLQRSAPKRNPHQESEASALKGTEGEY